MANRLTSQYCRVWRCMATQVFRRLIAVALALIALTCTGTDTGRENVSEYIDGFAPKSLQYSESTLVFYEGVAVTAQIPSISARSGLKRCESSPALPAGLVLAAETCALSGTPTTAQSEVQYTITGSNDFGSTSTQVAITVYIPPPSNLVYSGSPFTLSNYTSVGTITPTFTGTATSCTASPGLPAGLSLNNTTCAITGTATTYQNPADYTITASNALGSTSTTINIRVDECYLRGCFRDNMNGTVSFTGSGDGYTGVNLVFMKCSQGQVWSSATNDCTGTGSAPNYGAATYTSSGGGCSSLSFAGRSAGSWRMPTGNELATLIQCTNRAKVAYPGSCGAGNYTVPAISVLFPQTPSTGGSFPGRYWSGETFVPPGSPPTTFQYTSNFFDSTYSGARPNFGGFQMHVRCVATGP